MNKNQVTEIINHLKQRGYVCCEDNLLAAFIYKSTFPPMERELKLTLFVE